MQNAITAAEAATSCCTIPRIGENAIHRPLGGETVILDADGGHYYALNATATAIWDLCDGKRTTGEIIDALCSEFDITRAAAQASLQRLLRDLVEARLVVLDVRDEVREHE
jgi:hypothetical protein